jgi:hypothetical protein
MIDDSATLKFQMNTRDPHALIEKLKSLPPERVAEVEDFVDFLRARDEERALVRAATRAAEPAFAKLWDNDADAAYDKL